MRTLCYLRSRSSLQLAVLAAYCIALSVAQAAPPYVDRPVVEVLEELRSEGTPLVYSSDLVPRGLRVLREPVSDRSLDVARDILTDHGLTLVESGGYFLVVQSQGAGGQGALLVSLESGDDSSPVFATVRLTGPESRSMTVASSELEFSGLPPGRYSVSARATMRQAGPVIITVAEDSVSRVTLRLRPVSPPLEEITVSASRYALAGDWQTTTNYLSRGDIESLADLGDDPIRAMQRLPGAASTDPSAKSHIRGGDDDEVTYVLDGLQLTDPFHVRDYQSLFSTIDSRAISSAEVYSGGFPARFGNSMSGVMLIEPRAPGEEFNHEIALSTLEAAVLTSGVFAENQGSWLASLRRGTLDLLLDRELGKPSYGSLYGNVRLELDESHTLSVNALASEDDILITVSDDVDEQERSRSNTENVQLWAKLDSRWTDRLSSQTLVSSVNFSNLRRGFVNDPTKIVGSVDDARSLDSIGFKQDWSLNLSDRQLVRWGIELRQLSASFAYSSAAELRGFSAAFENVQPSTLRDIVTSPDGRDYGLYVSDRWSMGDRLTVEAGLRWDKQTYLPTESGESQVSPRLSVLYEAGPSTDLRASWGKYYQSQGLLQLQVEDGIDRYFPAQLATHLILSVEHRLENDLAMRVEAYDKRAPELRSRFENLFDPLSVIPELEPDRIEIAPTEARSRGVEFLISKDSRAPLTWWASFTYSRSEDLIAGRWIPRSWDQRRAASAGATWSGERWTLSAAASYHTGWPITSLALETDVRPDGSTDLRAILGERNAERLGSFARVDARVSRDIRTGAGNLQLFVEATNLLDRKNPCCVDYDLDFAAGGTPMLEKKIEQWLPRVVSVGVRWQF